MPPQGALSPARSLRACWPGCLKGTFSHLIWTAKDGERLCLHLQQLCWALRLHRGTLGINVISESPFC